MHTSTSTSHIFYPSTSQSSFLRTNFEILASAMESNFIGQDVKVKSIRYEYGNCAASFDLWALSDACFTEGPGIQIQVEHNYLKNGKMISQYRKYYYSEHMCPNYKKFIDQLNTDLIIVQVLLNRPDFGVLQCCLGENTITVRGKKSSFPETFIGLDQCLKYEGAFLRFDSDAFYKLTGRFVSSSKVTNQSQREITITPLTEHHISLAAKELAQRRFQAIIAPSLGE